MHLAMMITMFKRPLPKQFSFKARYHNPEDEVKARREQKMKRANEEYQYDAEGLRTELGYRWNLHRESKSSFHKKYSSYSRLISLAIIAALIIITFIYLKSI
jgi:hypothetical protein